MWRIVKYLGDRQYVVGPRERLFVKARVRINDATYDRYGYLPEGTTFTKISHDCDQILSLATMIPCEISTINGEAFAVETGEKIRIVYGRHSRHWYTVVRLDAVEVIRRATE